MYIVCKTAVAIVQTIISDRSVKHMSFSIFMLFLFFVRDEQNQQYVSWL